MTFRPEGRGARRAALLFLAAFAPIFPAVRAESDFDPEVRETVRKYGPAVVGLSCRTDAMQYFGTGVVISPEGLVLTNVTVIPPGATDIEVWFLGGRVIPAKLVSADPDTEGSLIQAESKDPLPFVELADSEGAWIGQRTYTFGNPFSVIQHDGEVATSVGILSGIYELTDNGDDQSKYKGLVYETDAAVNPGSDGGPVLDRDGRLLGIMSLGFQKERRLGTAIPLHVIRAKIEGFQSIELHPTTASGSDEPVGTVLARAAQRIRSAVVALEIEREPEEAWKPENQPSSGLELQQQRLRQMMERPAGLATGVAIQGGEYILTSAYHVTHAKEAEWKEGDAPLIKKILVHAEGLDAPIEATVVARNDPYDLALLKPAKKLPAATEISENIEVGWGHYVGILGVQRGSRTPTLTAGTVSTPERNHELIKVVQTDALMDYANLGGPVIDLEGRVVGIATFVEPDSGMGLNSGVAVFSGANAIQKLLPALVAGESMKKPPLPVLGVGAWSGEDPAKGALVAVVYKGSAAHKAGVLPGDTILSVDGNPIGEWPDLVRTITSKEIGQEIEFEVLRGEEKSILKATLGRRP